MENLYTPHQLATGNFPWLPAKGNFHSGGALYMMHVSNEGHYFFENGIMYIKDVEPADPEEYSPAYVVQGETGMGEWHIRFHGPVTAASQWHWEPY